MKIFSAFLFLLSMSLVFSIPNKAYSADDKGEKYKLPEKKIDGGPKRGKGPVGMFHPEDYVDIGDPKSLWYGYGSSVNRRLDFSKVAVPMDNSALSKEYSKKAIPHVKDIAKYCNGQWAKQKCLRYISSMTVELTKDYMKRLYYSKVAPDDLKVPFQEILKENCSGVIMKSKDEAIPLSMSDNLKKCLNVINYVSEKTEVYPDRDLRQLAMGSSFCIIRQPQCQVIEKQLLLVAKPKIQETAKAAPVTDSKDNK